MKNILVVDDDEGFLTAMKDILVDYDFMVHTCSKSTEALSTIQKGSYQFILLDYSMPDIDGQDLLHLIRSHFPNIRVIICTGHSEIQDTFFVRDGAYGVLHKPFDHSILLETLQVQETKDEITPVLVKGFDLKQGKDLLYRKLIIKALSKTNFNVTHAAKLLSVSRQNLLRYMKTLKIGH